jgi:hypothetical protein
MMDTNNLLLGEGREAWELTETKLRLFRAVCYLRGWRAQGKTVTCPAPECRAVLGRDAVAPHDEMSFKTCDGRLYIRCTECGNLLYYPRDLQQLGMRFRSGPAMVAVFVHGVMFRFPEEQGVGMALLTAQMIVRAARSAGLTAALVPDACPMEPDAGRAPPAPVSLGQEGRP